MKIPKGLVDSIAQSGAFNQLPSVFGVDDGERPYNEYPTVTKQDMLRGCATDEYELARQRYGNTHDKMPPTKRRTAPSG